MQRVLGGKKAFSQASDHLLSWGAGLRIAHPLSGSRNPLILLAQTAEMENTFPQTYLEVGRERALLEAVEDLNLNHFQLNPYLTFSRRKKKSVFSLQQGQFKSHNFKKMLSSCECWSYKPWSKEVMRLFGRGKITNKSCLHDFQQQIGHIPSQLWWIPCWMFIK